MCCVSSGISSISYPVSDYFTEYKQYRGRRQESFGILKYNTWTHAHMMLLAYCENMHNHTTHLHTYTYKQKHTNIAHARDTIKTRADFTLYTHIQLSFGRSVGRSYVRCRKSFASAIYSVWMILFHWCRSIRINVFRFTNKHTSYFGKKILTVSHTVCCFVQVVCLFVYITPTYIQNLFFFHL